MKPSMDWASELRGRAAAAGIDLPLPAAGRMVALLEALAAEPQNLTTVRGVEAGLDRHLLDSLSALVLPVVREARALLDLGSGGGFPGLPLAIARPGVAVTLVESERSKADWLVRAAADLPNVAVVAERAELVALERRGEWDLVTARAVAALPTLVELAAPLLAPGGRLLAWRGPRDHPQEERAERVARMLGLAPGPVHRSVAGAAGERHLHEYARVATVPTRVPRRPGRASKRPLA